MSDNSDTNTVAVKGLTASRFERDIHHGIHGTRTKVCRCTIHSVRPATFVRVRSLWCCIVSVQEHGAYVEAQGGSLRKEHDCFQVYWAMFARCSVMCTRKLLNSAININCCLRIWGMTCSNREIFFGYFVGLMRAKELISAVSSSESSLLERRVWLEWSDSAIL